IKNRVLVGMILFVASEAIFFLMLVLAYVNFHKVTGAQAASLLDPIKTGLFSIALFSSSFTVWLAEKALERQSATLVRLWLFMTILLGAIFIGGQGMEYARLLTNNITISRDLFGSTIFTLTGFHGLNVIIGLILLSLIFGLAVWGRK